MQADRSAQALTGPADYVRTHSLLANYRRTTSCIQVTSFACTCLEAVLLVVHAVDDVLHLPRALLPVHAAVAAVAAAVAAVVGAPGLARHAGLKQKCCCCFFAFFVAATVAAVVVNAAVAVAVIVGTAAAVVVSAAVAAVATAAFAAATDVAGVVAEGAGLVEEAELVVVVVGVVVAVADGQAQLERRNKVLQVLLMLKNCKHVSLSSWQTCSQSSWLFAPPEPTTVPLSHS